MIMLNDRKRFVHGLTIFDVVHKSIGDQVRANGAVLIATHDCRFIRKNRCRTHIIAIEGKVIGCFFNFEWSTPIAFCELSLAHNAAPDIMVTIDTRKLALGLIRKNI